WNAANFGFGPCIVDSAGTGVAAMIYSAPRGPLLARIATYSTYQGTYVEPGLAGTNPNVHQWASLMEPPTDRPVWWRIRKSGNDYFMAYSLDGEVWSPETAALTVALTVDRIGLLHHPLGTAAPIAASRIEVDWFTTI